MDEMGHTDPALALRLYRHAMRRGEGEKAKLCALVEGDQNAGASAALDPPDEAEPLARGLAPLQGAPH
jgi:hypothetical protein